MVGFANGQIFIVKNSFLLYWAWQCLYREYNTERKKMEEPERGGGVGNVGIKKENKRDRAKAE